jgi:hypothetical protein
MYRQRPNRFHSLLLTALAATALALTAGACSDKLHPPTGPGPADPIIPPGPGPAPDERVIFTRLGESGMFTIEEMSLRDSVADTLGTEGLFAYDRQNGARVVVSNFGLTIMVSAPNLAAPVALTTSSNWLIDAASVAVAPDGRMAAYMRIHFNSGQTELKVVRLPDLSQRFQAIIVPGNQGLEAEYSRLSFSPDSKQVAWFQSTVNGTYKYPGVLKVVDLSGSNPTMDTISSDGSRSLTAIAASDCVWSPDSVSNRVAVVASEGDYLQFVTVFDVFQERIIGTSPPSYPGDTIELDWSPDGESIVFTGGMNAFEPPDLLIWTEIGTASRVFQIMFTPLEHEQAPKWSSDGKKILCLVFDPNLSDSGELRVVELEATPDKKVRTLTHGIVSAFWK